MKKIMIITTVPMSLATLVKGQAKYLSNSFDVSLVSSYSKENEAIAHYEGVTLKSIEMTRQITLFKDLKALALLFMYMRKEKPDAVYTFTPKAGLLGMLASFFARVPVRIHNIVGMPLMEARGAKKTLLKFIEKVTYQFATHLFCNSFGLQEYIGKNLSDKEVRVIGQGSINGVDTEYFKNNKTAEEQLDIRDRHGIAKNDFVITFVGRIVKDKGINELIESFEELTKKYNSLKLLLVGDYEEHLNPIKEENKVLIETSKNIITVGFQSDIREFLSITDLFVLPSYREGLPNSLIEAGSFAIPLIATDINGCNEIIMNKETGLLVEKKDTVSLQNAIELLIKDKELYGYLKSNIRERTAQRYAQNYFWEELKNELQAIV